MAQTMKGIVSSEVSTKDFRNAVKTWYSICHYSAIKKRPACILYYAKDTYAIEMVIFIK